MHYFRKNIYTREVIDFMLEMLEKGRRLKSRLLKSIIFLKQPCISG